MYTVPPCDYKRRRRAPLKGDVGRDHPDTSTTLSTRYWHSPLSASPLAETWELPSLSRLACTPYYRHLRCKIIQCPHTPPLLDVRPRGRNQDKPVRYCITSCINIWDEKTRSIYLLGSGPPGRGTNTNSFLVASTSSLATSSAACLAAAAAAFSSASSASLLAFAAASVANAPLVLGVGCSTVAVAAGLAFFFLPRLAGFFFLLLFLQKMWNGRWLQSKKMM